MTNKYELVGRWVEALVRGEPSIRRVVHVDLGEVNELLVHDEHKTGALDKISIYSVIAVHPPTEGA